MLHEVKGLKKYTICGVDGTIGRVREFLFDDDKWDIRYVVVDTGKWLPGKKVLITPDNFIRVSKEDQCISVNLTRKQIEDSPPLSSNPPVDRQKQNHGYFVLPDSVIFVENPELAIMADLDRQEMYDQAATRNFWDQHLQSTHDSTGKVIQAVDGEAGCIEDFIFDDQTWRIRYIVVETTSWWPGHKILVAPPWVSQLSWGTSELYAHIRREPFKELEEYDSVGMLTREYETRLHQSCNRIGYWADDPACDIASRPAS